MVKSIGILVAVGIVMVSFPAYAFFYKNPGHDYSQGKNAVGFSVAAATMEFESDAVSTTADIDSDVISFDFILGVGKTGALGFHGGLIELSAEGEDPADGGQFGVSYRHALADVNDKLKPGLLFSFWSGFVDNETSETTFTRFDAGGGAGFKLTDTAHLYGGGVFTIATATIDNFAAGAIDIENVNNLGVFGGVELRPSDQMRLGLEVHAVNEDGIAFYLEFLL